mgnify:FL=1
MTKNTSSAFCVIGNEWNNDIFLHFQLVLLLILGIIPHKVFAVGVIFLGTLGAINPGEIDHFKSKTLPKHHHQSIGFAQEGDRISIQHGQKSILS